MSKLIGGIANILFIVSAMLFSGWVYMLVISIFSPISFKNAFVISLILNMIGLAFNRGRVIANDR